MKLLILGGTNFVGRAAAEDAIARGHDVFTFNRGTKDTPKGATPLVGDRLAPDGLKALDGLSFDAVIDTWSAEASVVRNAALALKGKVKHYSFVSSISVYTTDADGLHPPFNEDTPVVDPEKTDFKYAANKRGSEIAAGDAGVPVLIARPGLILGPWEIGQARLLWWLQRVHRGGRTLAPGPEDLGVNFIDARDLAKFLIDGVEKTLEGTFNVTSEPNHTSMGELLATANAATGGRAEFVWKTPEEILSAGIKPWTELPIWLPPGPDHDGMAFWDTSKARAAGLRSRHASETVIDTWAWLQATDEDIPTGPPKVGLDPEKEAKLLE